MSVFYKYTKSDMIKRLILCLPYFIYLFCSTNAYSQNEQLSLSHYMEGIQYYNPSHVGFDRMYSISAFHNIGKIKQDSLSHNTLFLLNIPIKLGKQNFGVGGEINMTNVGQWKNSEFSVSCAWIKEISNIKMSIGGGVIFRTYNANETPIRDNSDANNKTIPYGNAKGFDLSLGLSLSGYNGYLGLSSRNILGTRIMLGEIDVPMERNYNLITYYSFDLPSYKLSFNPSFIFSTNDNLKYRAEINIHSWYNKFVLLSLGYRLKDSFMAGIGAKLKDFRLGYVIRVPQYEMKETGWCTQEFFVSYQINMFFDNKKDNIRKSIRLL